MLVEALEHHRNRQHAARGEDKLFAPVRIEKRLRVEFDNLRDKAPVGLVGRRLYGREHSAQKFRQRVGAQSDPGDDAEPAAAALQRPEEIGIRAGVGDFNVAVGCHDFRLQHARSGRPIGLRKASKAPAQDEAGDADGHAAAALHVAAALGGDRVVSLSPIGPWLNRYGWLRLRVSCAAGTDERVVGNDRVHVARTITST